MKKRTICNPIDINYQYQKNYFSRESADPAVVLYHDEYYLFASHGSGYWVSSDLADWEFIQVDLEKQPEFRLFAPGPLVIGDRIYLTHSEGGAFLYSDNPRDPDSWVNIGRDLLWNDPAFHLEEDGSVYMYDGLSPIEPLYVSQLDPNDNMRLLQDRVAIFASDYKTRGFERRYLPDGEEATPWLEGSWMNKINGKYYLTYAVPGTEVSGYCDGCAIADAPMGPFVFCENSPVVYKATGFMRGAGHGCLFADKNGNWWKVDTVSISRNHMFERRLCLFPAKIGKTGNIYTNTYRGDYPMINPGDLDDPFTQYDAGWHVVSYGKTVRVSSVLDEAHKPAYAVDENLQTWWSAKTGDAGEWIEMDMGKVCDVYALQINFADQDADNVFGRGHGFSYRYTLEVSEDGTTWDMLIDRRESEEDRSNEYFELDEKLKIRYVRLTNCGMVPANGKFAVSGLRLFGHGGGVAPENAPVFQAVRCKDERDMDVTWDAVPGAEGYIIRFGVEPDELYTHWQVIGETSAKVKCLNCGVTYYVTVDAYNDSGVILGTQVVTV